jgi:hypothetical protein
VRIGRSIRYRRDALETFIDASTVWDSHQPTPNRLSGGNTGGGSSGFDRIPRLEKQALAKTRMRIECAPTVEAQVKK